MKLKNGVFYMRENCPGCKEVNPDVISHGRRYGLQIKEDCPFNTGNAMKMTHYFGDFLETEDQGFWYHMPFGATCVLIEAKWIIDKNRIAGLPEDNLFIEV